MKLARVKPKNKQDGTIALINVVFLMLIFFLIAGTVTPPINRDIDLLETKMTNPSTPKAALNIKADSSLFYEGAPIALASFIAKNEADRVKLFVVADKNLPAIKLVEIITSLKAQSNKPIQILTQRILK